MSTNSQELPDFYDLEPSVLVGYIESKLPDDEGSVLARLALDALRRRAEDAAVSSVTGLPNRKALELRAGAVRTTSTGGEMQRAGAPVSWLTAFLDLNRFKWINDQYGHRQGDRTLLIAGAAFRGSMRGEDDELYHLSGDEFVAFLPQRTLRGAVDFQAQTRLRGYLVTRFHDNLHLIAAGEGSALLPEGFALTDLDRVCAATVTGTFGFHISEGSSIDRLQQLEIADRLMQQLKPGSAER